jgi:RNase H-fold protein (predicted Holliday junction resolvase)
LETIIAIDPGREKCGLVVVSSEGRVAFRAVVATQDIAATVEQLIQQHAVQRIIMGAGTASVSLMAELRALCSVEIVRVDERFSTLEARRRFFAENPPRGWRRLIPLSLQVPPVAYDDYAALVLAERYFQRKNEIDK